MPYIKQEDRAKYDEQLNSIILDILSHKDNEIEMIDEYGKFVLLFTDAVLFGGLVARKRNDDQFHLTAFGEKCINIGSEVRIQCHPDILKLTGHVNYCITKVLWAILGWKTSYGIWVGLKFATLRRAADTIGNNAADVIYAVQHDVILETYRRKISVYENEKIVVNGDI